MGTGQGRQGLETFRYIAAALSIVLGLGVTRLLTGLVGVVRARHKSRLDWIIPTWAVVIFITQLEFWWAVNQLPTILPQFTFIEFVGLVLLTVTLFVTAALLVPSRGDDEDLSLRVFFQNEGRWALAAFSLFLFSAALFNVFLFGGSVLSLWAVLDIPMIVIPLIVCFSRRERLQEWLTIAYVPLTLIDVAVSVIS